MKMAANKICNILVVTIGTFVGTGRHSRVLYLNDGIVWVFIFYDLSFIITFFSFQSLAGKRLCAVCNQPRTADDKTPDGQIHRFLGKTNKTWCPYGDDISILQAFEKNQLERKRATWRRANEAKKLKKQQKSWAMPVVYVWCANVCMLMCVCVCTVVPCQVHTLCGVVKSVVFGPLSWKCAVVFRPLGYAVILGSAISVVMDDV